MPAIGFFLAHVFKTPLESEIIAFCTYDSMETWYTLEAGNDPL
jgi:hypothetical protein